ncbi:MAG: TraR/DksA C4-type zinc finger protein [bacterium]|nr:TraR/DksA C4-type zinc finger protein [bacterium]
MTGEEKEKVKSKITEEIESLRQSISSLEEMSKPVAPDVSLGRLTRMEAISSRGISEANLRSSRSRLSMLMSALKRIDDPDFGICIECEEPIPAGRLLIMPESRKCVHCAAG